MKSAPGSEIRLSSLRQAKRDAKRPADMQQGAGELGENGKRERGQGGYKGKRATEVSLATPLLFIKLWASRTFSMPPRLTSQG